MRKIPQLRFEPCLGRTGESCWSGRCGSKMGCLLSVCQWHGSSSIDLPFSPPPPTVTQAADQLYCHKTPSFSFTTIITPVAFRFLNADISDKCSSRHVITPVRSHERRRRGGQALCRGSRDRKGLFRHSLQGIPLCQFQYFLLTCPNSRRPFR